MSSGLHDRLFRGIRLWTGTTQGSPDLIVSGQVLLELTASGSLRDTDWVISVPQNLFFSTETQRQNFLPHIFQARIHG